MEKTKVGFIGLGQMGSAIAERLLTETIELHVHDTSSAAMERFVAAGAVAHRSAKSVADAASIVFACVPSPAVSLEVAFGPEGIAQGSAVRIYADMSTIGPKTIGQIADGLRERGIDTVDSPVTGGPPIARKGLLTMLVAGASTSINQLRPILEIMGKEIYVLGDRPGMAQMMKLVNNVVMASNMVVAGEALSMGVRAGLNADTMLQALGSGTGQSFVVSQVLQRVISGTFDYGATLSIVAKDIKLGVAEAELLGVSVPLLSQASDEWQEAQKKFGREQDFTRLLCLYEERIGTEIRRKSI